MLQWLFYFTHSLFTIFQYQIENVNIKIIGIILIIESTGSFLLYMINLFAP